MWEEMRPNSISPLPPQQGNELREDYDDDTPKNCRVSQDGVEAAERDEDFAEERFRVDRRKLEQLIRASEDEENAEDFFLKIMQATQTHIAWPSKLKIGAKSKKDPHIKISGSHDAVLEAKTRILASLDTKSLRVTLKMDVSHTEHSHVIGKGGNNIKRVMQDTGCHIHFPDSNRNNQIEKSNQVSVAGLCSAVEQARVKIRDLLPLVFMFDVPVSSANQLNPDFSPILDHIQQHYGVNVSLKPHHQPYIRTVLIRGSVYNMKSARQAATLIFEHLTGRTGVVFGVSLLMDISPQHHLFIIGHGGTHINHIMQRTSTTIHFPDPNTTVPQKRGNIYISGTMPNVFMARQHLLDCLPLVLMFDLKDDADVDQAQISYMSEHLGVHIGIKPKPKQPSKSVVIKSMERNVSNMYEARQRILGIDEEIPVVTGLTFSASDLAGPNLHYAVPNTNKPDTVMVLPGHNVMPAFIPGAANSPGPVYRHVMMLPAQPPFQFPPSQLPPVLYSPPMFQTVPPNDHMHQHPITSSKGANSQTPASSTININHAMHNLKVNQPVEIMTDPQANLFPNINTNCSTSLAATTPNPSASDVDQAISSLANLIMNHETLKNALLNHSENNSTKLLNRLIDSSGKDHHLSCNTVGGGVHYGLSTDGLNYHQPSSIKDHASVQFAHLDHNVCQHLGNLLSSNMQNGEGMMMEPGAESDSSSDHSSKAPGSNRPKKSVNSAVYFEEVENGMQADVDYQKLRFMADQAMQKKPSGESRIPTDYWAGLFFSKSMPQSAISEKLNNMSGRYTGPNMTTQYEVGEEDAENEGVWKETPSDPSPSLSNQLSPTESLMNLVTQLSAQTSGLSMPHKLFDQGDLQNKSSLWPISDQVQSSELGDLDPLFHEIGLSKYVNIFKQQEIDMSTFLTLDDKDLRDLGVTTFGARRKMLLAIADLNKKQSEIPPPPGLSNPFRDANLMRRHDVVSQSVRW